MKKFNPIYLWCSVVLWFPLLHELGHYLIAYLCGVQVVGLEWNRIYFASDNAKFVQDLWEYSMLLPTLCVGVWSYFFVKHYDVSKKWVDNI
jgi:hypothetical protein